MKLVVALGGNALGNTPDEQKRLVAVTAKSIVELIEQGNEVVLTHGNGPQVGMINAAFDMSSRQDCAIPAMPFPECGAMSQGYIGYHLQNAIGAELRRRGDDKTVVAVITQVVVDSADKAFDSPTKPIGNFVDETEAQKLTQNNGYVMKDFGDRGYRRVVASPTPIDIVEKKSIAQLIDSGSVVITVGGGGIPVVREGNELTGVAAVIDKDFASALLASQLNADKLIILTAVHKVSLNYGKSDQIDLDRLTATEAEGYIEQGQFGKGSMLPKVQACLNFVKGGLGRQAIIADLTKAEYAIKGESGTVIVG